MFQRKIYAISFKEDFVNIQKNVQKIYNEHDRDVKFQKSLLDAT